MPRKLDVIGAAPAALRQGLEGDPPRAAGLIVTIYGDVVGPRGGTLWMGTLIECCADHGISESLVRTAVSRLVSGGQLEGERIGRKSYYRLTPAALDEFAGAARVLYAPPPLPTGWLLALGEGAVRAASLPGWAQTGPETALAPNRGDVARPPGLLLSAETVAGAERVPDFAARHWPVEEVAAAYRAFLDVFAPVAGALAEGARPAPPLALALRLRLVHLYRQAALADPRLPRAAWPEGWSGAAARRLFVRTYLALTEAADAHIGRSFHDSAGPLPEQTEETRLRCGRLERELASQAPDFPEEVINLEKHHEGMRKSS
ncbi:PaaX family transcriptional regulator C-terminal domain-containing protein [Acidimangrovimonas pyrenivorans]|uniref:PaaX family transcriptional regulator C-terminal domain-containing protein n=1 Tax=Acidimangrovimonas pyrenivorans TaxID=2030798 RepID=A0ABV7AMQ8_9RHOB